MNERRKSVSVGLVAGVGGTLVLLAGIGLLVVYTGGLNVAATEGHTALTRWAFDTTLKSSVTRRAADISEPEAFTQAMIVTGASEYQAMCEHCHAGPGVERSDWASGMRPRPPHLTEVAADWEVKEVFWLARHGVKMTGMPAFGPSHDDHTLWSIAAFVKQLPAMTPERYAALGAEGKQQGGHGH